MTSTVKDWRETVTEEQQEMCNLLGEVDWDKYEENEFDVLEEKVCVLLYGPLVEDDSDNEESKDANLKSEVVKVKEDRKILLSKICKLIVSEGTQQLEGVKTCKASNNKATYMVFIFVFWKDTKGNTGCELIFRVPNDNTGSNASFIDLRCRVYKTWEDFLENNQLPACEYCYPRGGKYQTIDDKVAVDFDLSPDAKLGRKVLNGLDIATAGVGTAATAVLLTGIAFPLAAPIITAVSVTNGVISGYSIVRSSVSLHDRSTHGQSIGLLDKEARGCYLSIAASAIGFGASAATSATVRIVQEGRVIGRVAAGAVTALNGGALAINGVSVINSLHHLVEKQREGDLTAMDVAQFSASLLLFCHSTVKFQTAQSIIESTQNKVLDDFKQSLRSNRHRKAFNRGFKKTVAQHGNTEGKAQVIRAVSKIDNVDDFFASLVRTRKEFNYTKNSYEFADGGLIKVNNAQLDPRQIAALKKDQRVTVLRATQRYSANRLSEVRFNEIMRTLLSDMHSTSNVNTTAANKVLSCGNASDNTTQDLLKKYIMCGLLTVPQLVQLGNHLNIFSPRVKEIILKLTQYLFNAMKESQGNNYMIIFHFIRQYVQDQILLFNDQRKYALAVLKGKIRCVAPENMTNDEYCLALLEQLLLNPTVMLDIFLRIRSCFNDIYCLTNISQRDSGVNFLELVSAVNILTTIDRPLWLQVIDFAQKIFHALGLRKFSSLIAVIKELCSYIQQVVFDMEERYGAFRGSDGGGDYDGCDDDVDSISNDLAKYQNFCTTAVESLNDSEVFNSLKEHIKENNGDIFQKDTSATSAIYSVSQEYFKANPLIMNKDFWADSKHELLSEREILQICTKILQTGDIITNYIIQCEGLKYFAVLGEKRMIVICIECDIYAGKVIAYVDNSALSTIENYKDTNFRKLEDKSMEFVEESHHSEYTKQSPLIRNVCFWSNKEGEILTYEEIIEVCRQTLRKETFPEECTIEYDGLNILINVESRKVVVECDLYLKRIRAYVDPLDALSTPANDPNRSSQPHNSVNVNKENTDNYFSKEAPLIIKKTFGSPNESELLTEEEILNVCKLTLKMNKRPEECIIEYDGLKILFSMEDKVVVLECDILGKRICAYVDPFAKLLTSTQNLHHKTEVKDSIIDRHYIKEDPLVVDKHFDNKYQSELLNEKEILQICKMVLCGTDIPQDASFDYYGSTIFVYFQDKIIAMDCNTEKDIVKAYVQTTFKT